MENLVKIGYARIVSNKFTSYINMKEFHSYSKETINWYKNKLENSKEIEIFCACQKENELELIITSTGILRVKKNSQQELHKESCPKSIYYSNWCKENQKGLTVLEGENTEDFIYNLAIPSIISSKNTSDNNASSSNKTEKNNVNSKMKIEPFVKSLISIAWEKQTFSVKKAIAISNKEKKAQTWEYKDVDDFIRLIFGVSNDIKIKLNNDIMPFSSICYKPDVYFDNYEYSKKFFILAKISKISEYKERVYQYVTLEMYSLQGKRITVRIKTPLFLEIFGEEEPFISNEDITILAGYVYRDIFVKGKEIISDWMTLISGFVFQVNKKGLIIENKYEKYIFDFLNENRVIYKIPYTPIETYNNRIPLLVIERMKEKNIIVEIATDSRTYKKLKCIAENCKEYEVIILDSTSQDINEMYEIIKQNM